MTEATVEEQLANHGARITGLEVGFDRIEKRLDQLFFFLIGNLAASCGGLLIMVLTRK